MDDFDLTERMITAAEFAAILGVTEDDVLQWMLAGKISYVDDPQGEPRVSILEQHCEDGPMTYGFISYPISRDAEFEVEVARRRRERELETMDWGEVDVEALARALAVRLRTVAPSACRVTVESAMISVSDLEGHGVRIDIAYYASFLESGSGGERVRGAAVSALEGAQDELAMLTTDPWPSRGSGELPAPHAEFMSDGAAIRLFYGDPADPVLELEPLQVSDVLGNANG